MKTSGCILLVLGMIVGWTVRSTAQTPSPAAAASSEKPPDFSGTWTLDRRLSDDPAKVNFDAVQGGQSQGANRRRGGSFGGFGGRGGFGQGGSSGNRDNTNASRTPDERARLAALTGPLKNASAMLTISHHDPSFVITDAQDHTLFFHTDASPDDHPLGTVTITSTSHWAGDRIVTEFAVSSRSTLVYTYTLLPATNQLVLRVRAQFNGVSGANAPELKLVYSLTPLHDTASS